jgi:hypothetical protein
MRRARRGGAGAVCAELRSGIDRGRDRPHRDTLRPVVALDAKWLVPESYDITERDVALPPPRGVLGTQPLFGILSLRALEDQATGDGVLALVAWQMIAGAPASAAQTLERLANTMELSGLELLMLGHAYVGTGVGEGAGFETAQRARKILKQPITAHSIDASLLLAVTALPFGVERVKTLLEMLEPELQHGTDEHRAVHALLRATVGDPAAGQLDDAFARFTALDDHVGVAQCALLAYSREVAAAKRTDVMRGYLEHAIYRYDADGRPEWAARTILHGVIPLLVDADGKPQEPQVAEQLSRAAAFALQARSLVTLELVFRTASKLGYGGSATTLGQVDPPTFTKRDAAAVAAAPAAEPKPKKTATKKPKKRAGA